MGEYKKEMEEIIIMGDVEIVVKVPEGIPREVVEKSVLDRINKYKIAEGTFGKLKKYRLSKVLEKVDEEWGL